jgi:hypothetical protein
MCVFKNHAFIYFLRPPSLIRNIKFELENKIDLSRKVSVKEEEEKKNSKKWKYFVRRTNFGQKTCSRQSCQEPAGQTNLSTRV